MTKKAKTATHPDAAHADSAHSYAGIDILAFGAHPDDVELSCAGVLVGQQQQGYTTGIVDLTRGECGTQGTTEDRAAEAAKAARIMKLSERVTLDLPDSGVQPTHEQLQPVIDIIRRLRPRLVIAPAPRDRHPDHGHASTLVTEAAYYAGLQRYDADGPPWRPEAVIYYMQYEPFEPDFIVDVTDVFDIKMQAIRAYASQFEPEDQNKPKTLISTPAFLINLEARARVLGQKIGVDFGEGFQVRQGVPVVDLMATFTRQGENIR
jgi:N-acetylglucosamine malate deacetylase 1